MNQRKTYRFDFGNGNRATVSVGGEESYQRLRKKLNSFEEAVNWDLFKENVQTIKKK